MDTGIINDPFNGERHGFPSIFALRCVPDLGEANGICGNVAISAVIAPYRHDGGCDNSALVEDLDWSSGSDAIVRVDSGEFHFQRDG